MKTGTSGYIPYLRFVLRIVDSNHGFAVTRSEENSHIEPEELFCSTSRAVTYKRYLDLVSLVSKDYFDVITSSVVPDRAFCIFESKYKPVFNLNENDGA